MRTGMPEDFLSNLVVKSEEFQQAVSFELPSQINKFVVFGFLLCLFLSFGADRSLSEGGIVSLSVFNSGNEDVFGQIFGDALGDYEWGGEEGLSLDLLAVFELNNGRVTVTVISGLGTSARTWSILSLICAKNFSLHWVRCTCFR